jgi:hypothetical protein
MLFSAFAGGAIRIEPAVRRRELHVMGIVVGWRVSRLDIVGLRGIGF